MANFGPDLAVAWPDVADIGPLLVEAGRCLTIVAEFGSCLVDAGPVQCGSEFEPPIVGPSPPWWFAIAPASNPALTALMDSEKTPKATDLFLRRAYALRLGRRRRAADVVTHDILAHERVPKHRQQRRHGTDRLRTDRQRACASPFCERGALSARISSSGWAKALLLEPRKQHRVQYLATPIPVEDGPTRAKVVRKRAMCGRK